MSWRETALHYLRVPARPEPPPGSPPRVFNAAPNFFKYRLVGWALTQLLAVAGLLWAIFFVKWMDSTRTPDFVIWLMKAGEVFGWLALAFEVVVGWMFIRLDYEMRWYMLSDRAIRIREGILTIREKTIALANVQNLAVRQGPLQRLLGIADVEVKTAGGGGSSSEMQSKKGGAEPMHVAYFRGVANAEEIRDLVREGVRIQRNAGLGDPDEVETGPTTTTVDDAVAELLREARALRSAI
ncbi:MAG TPA: PH domain-containing protein [Thermoanaerobaculia bacterium]